MAILLNSLLSGGQCFLPLALFHSEAKKQRQEIKTNPPDYKLLLYTTMKIKNIHTHTPPDHWSLNANPKILLVANYKMFYISVCLRLFSKSPSSSKDIRHISCLSVQQFVEHLQYACDILGTGDVGKIHMVSVKRCLKWGWKEDTVHVILIKSG